MKKLNIEKGLLDHLLVMVGGVSSVFSIGQSLGKETMAWTLALLVIATSMAGYGLSKALEKTPLIRWDAGLWTLFGLGSFLASPFLNRLLPEGGFPMGLLPGAFLSWMIVVCSLFSWRDRTLLFVSLPCIALYGLVGTFDTFAPGTWLFFAFLVATGVLYARVHQRAMAERAKLAGADDPSLLVRGPWKWMAGPEWAFVSGFLIIILSLMGAPVVRQTVQPVAGAVRVNLPQAQPNNPARAPTNVPQTAIGRGPNNPSDTPVFRVYMDRLGLLRSNHLVQYTGRGWSTADYVTTGDDPAIVTKDSRSDDLPKGPNGGVQGWPGKGLPPGEQINDPAIIEIELEPIGFISNRLLAPGPVVEVETRRSGVTFFGYGDVLMESTLMPGTRYRYWAAVPAGPPSQETEAKFENPAGSVYRSTYGIQPAVRNLAREVTRDSRSDYEAALAIKRAITSRVRYNLNAAAVPQEEDPVEHFLFKSQEGYCDLFASSMVLMARAIGLPARYTEGWLVDSSNVEGNHFLMREKDYHAWAEIYFEGYGWVPFDATEGAEEVPSGRRGSSRTANDPFWTRDWFLPLLAGLGIVAFAVPLILGALKLLRRQMDPSERGKTELAQAHAQFHLGIEKVTGSPKRFSQTLREYTDSQSPKLGALSEEAGKITSEFEQAMFSPQQLSREEIKALLARVKAFRADLAAQEKARRQAQGRNRAA